MSPLSQPFYLPRVCFFFFFPASLGCRGTAALRPCPHPPESQVCFTECQRAKHCFSCDLHRSSLTLRLGHRVRLSVVVSLSILPHLQSSTGTTGTLCHLICHYSFYFFSAASKKDSVILYLFHRDMTRLSPRSLLLSLLFLSWFLLRLSQNFYVYFRFKLQILFSFFCFVFWGGNHN